MRNKLQKIQPTPSPKFSALLFTFYAITQLLRPWLT